MTRSVLALLATMVVGANIYSQKVEMQPKSDTQASAASPFKPATIELITPWIIIPGQKSTFSNERHLSSCFDFESLAYDCGRDPGLDYGTRVGVNWDLFQVHGGMIDRTRMVEIGKYGWTDKFTVPYVEPWRALAPGETRAITINASGTPVSLAGKNKNDLIALGDMNGNGTFTPKERPKTSSGTTYAMANVKQQVSSTVKGNDGKVRNDAYSPIVEVKKGYMYVVHVVNAISESYVLVHVDDVVHGESVKLSFIKILISPL